MIKRIRPISYRTYTLTKIDVGICSMLIKMSPQNILQ